MESTRIIEQLQGAHKNKLILSGLAALQYPAVQTRQLTFFNPGGGKEDYYTGSCHVFIRRAPRKKIGIDDHLLFIARHIELYAEEVNLLISILQDIDLKDLEGHDRAWRIFAYLKKRLLQEPVSPKKIIGRRSIDLGDISSPFVIRDTALHIRDALLVPPFLRQKIWVPGISHPPGRHEVESALRGNRAYFSSKKILPLFHRFARYVSRLESAASAKIEGYDAHVEAHSLKGRWRQKLKANLALRANLNMDNLHRDLVNLSREPLSLELLTTVQKAIVKDTWRNDSEKTDKMPGRLRHFDEVIVDRGKMGEENVVYIAPKHGEVKPLLEELVEFYHHSRFGLHPLDLAAIFKCQLTVIHPFGDGNGRLARWCFLYILIREHFIESVHQAPVSHIFLTEKNRYYEELLKVDRSVMEKAGYSVDPVTHRYRARYDSADIYRNLDYSSWLTYVYDAMRRALVFSVEEHAIFEKVQGVYSAFEKKTAGALTPNQQHEVVRAIDIGLKWEWGKKTEKRLLNNGLDEAQIKGLKELVRAA